MVLYQYFGHEHPLVFNEEQINQSEASPHKCSRCGEAMLGLSYSCTKCMFYLHKKCAEAPSQIDHPLHPNHPLCLLSNPPSKYRGKFMCDFCGEEGMMFSYHCSDCEFDLHIKCALVSSNFAEKKFEDQLKHIAFKDPSLSTENGDQLQSAKCFGCWEPLCDYIYYSFDGGFNLHKKCADLPFQMNYPLHYKHPLILHLSGHKIFSCVICHDTERRGFFYGCSRCNFGIHVACLSPPSIIEDEAHQHPFTLFSRHFSFTCDACGVEGNGVPYMCSNCNHLVHKKCISLPRVIQFTWHEHPISHTYFFKTHESEKWECVVCNCEVNTDHGSYYCQDCHFIVHVNCVLKRKGWYHIVEQDETGENSILFPDESMDSFIVIKRNEDGDATKIKHFTHAHDLILIDKIAKEDRYCDGCTLFILDSSYCCSQCNYFLHKKCAEFPRKKHLWFHKCRQLLLLTSGNIFKCCYCNDDFNGFAYRCNKCGGDVCLRCVIPHTLSIEEHEHPLSYYVEYEGYCNACGFDLRRAFACKICKFALHWYCVGLPRKVGHKCDHHPLTLTDHDNNDYSESYFCDICEEKRNSNCWFYHCSICDTSAHLKCVLGIYPFFKLGKSYLLKVHPHHLALVKKMYYYPSCDLCDKPCQELALECTAPGCGYIVHADCIK